MPASKYLLTYSAAATAFLAGPASVQAQVVYTDLDPDITLNEGESYGLDVDNDGEAEFTISNILSTIDSFFYVSSGNLPDAHLELGVMYPLGPHSAAGQFPDGFYAYQLPGSYLIGYGLNFQNEPARVFYNLSAIDYPAPGSYYPVSNEGNFPIGARGFVPLALQWDSETYFGWVRLEIVEGPAIIIDDYAFEMSIEQPILTPVDTITTLTQTPSLEPLVFSYNNAILIDMEGIASSASYSLHDMSGREIANGVIEGTGLQHIPVQTTPGVYLFRLQWNGHVYSKRLFL